MNKLPEEIKYRKVKPAQITCPDKPQEEKYKPNRTVGLEECKKCSFHRGHSGDKIACAWKKEEDN